MIKENRIGLLYEHILVKEVKKCPYKKLPTVPFKHWKQILKKFTEYIIKDNIQRFKGLHNFNIKDAVLISHSEQKTSDHEEADTTTALHSSESRKPGLVKAKDRYFNFNGAWFSLVISCYDCLVSTDRQWQNC